MQPKLQISYPCEWPYVVIGLSESELRMAIGSVVANRTHTITVSNISAKGKYISLKILVVVSSDDERNSIYTALQNHPATKVVI